MNPDPFTIHRNLLFRVAYDLLGSVADAEDVLQDTWLRWSAADRSGVRDPRAFLVRTVTNQSLNRMRSNRNRRETYVGPWLPEPLVGREEDPSDTAEREQDVSLALLVVLETLGPDERAVFVLREVFGMSHDEVATALDRTPASVRQLAHRAREHVQARRPRYETDHRVQRQATEQFLRAATTGDLAGLLAQLAPDVTLVTDGGGRVRGARRPILGADKVSRFLVGISGDAVGIEFRLELVNGALGFVGYTDGVPMLVALLELDADGLVSDLYMMGNPDKLAHLRT